MNEVLFRARSEMIWREQNAREKKAHILACLLRKNATSIKKFKGDWNTIAVYGWHSNNQKLKPRDIIQTWFDITVNG